MKKQDNNSPHILNAASNLLGLCFVLLTSIQLLKLQHETYIDDVTAIAFILFMISTLSSFLSIRSEHASRSKRLESVAEFVFIAGLIFLFIAAIIISTTIIK